MSGMVRQQQQTIEDGLMAILFFVLVIGFISVFAWFKLHAAICHLMLLLLRAELWPVTLWDPGINSTRALMAAADPRTVTFRQLLASFAFVGRIYKIPAAIILAGLGGLCIMRASGERFTTRLDLDGLMRVQSKVFPSINAFLDRSFGMVAPRLAEAGPLSSDFSLHLGEWIAIHALTGEKKYDPDAARLALAAQLGPHWTTPQAASPSVRAMYAVLALHISRDRTRAIDLLGVLSASIEPDVVDVAGTEDQASGNVLLHQVRPGNREEAAQAPETADPTEQPFRGQGLFDRAIRLFGRGPGSRADADCDGMEEDQQMPLRFSPAVVADVDNLLADGTLIAPALAVAGRFAFTTTVMMGLLMHARRRAGVLAPGQFAFLKLVDRNLWYALHALGFPVSDEQDGPMPNPRIEALGARAHWEAERAAGEALYQPHIEAAEATIRARIAHSLSISKPITEIK
jgi:hypothetical protein